MNTTAPLSYSMTHVASHMPEHTIIDLDYPMYGTVIVKCGGRKFDLEVVRKALDLVYEMNGKLARQEAL